MTFNRQTVLLLIMLATLLGGGFYYFVTIPLKTDIAGLQADLKQEQAYVATLLQAGKEKQQESRVPEFPPQYQSQIPEAPYLEQIMLDMSRLQTISGVEMGGIGLSNSLEKSANEGQDALPETAISFPAIGDTSQNPVPSFPGMGRVGISTKIHGTYNQINRFFTELRNLPRIVTIESMKVSAGTEYGIHLRQKEEDQRVSAELSMYAYFAPVLAPYFPNPLPIIVPPPGNHTSPFH